MREIASARYKITLEYDTDITGDALKEISNLFSQKPVTIMKKSKRGEKEVDITELIRSISFSQTDNNIIIDAVLAAGNESLNPELLVRAIKNYAPNLDIVVYIV